MEAHEQHQKDLMAAFAELVQAENEAAGIKAAAEATAAQYAANMKAAHDATSEAWQKIEKLLKETGEVSATLPGTVTDYEIYRTTTRESVKVIDPGAVPEAFCKTERKPKLKEIGDYLRAQERASLPLPNWATIQQGDSTWAWRAKKKTTKE